MSLLRTPPGLTGPLRMDRPAIYRIVVSGRLDERWRDLFGGLNISEIADSGQGVRTLLVGKMTDQSELSGVLTALYESHSPVISVDCLEEL